MRIACLQFAAQDGDSDGILARANKVLLQADEKSSGLDLMVLPEMAFTGLGPARLWACETAKMRNINVVMGYWDNSLSPESYSMVMVNALGECMLHLRQDEYLSQGEIPGLGKVCVALGKDLSTCLASHALKVKANVMVVYMPRACQSHLDSMSIDMPDIDTVGEWIYALMPLMAEPAEETVVIFCNTVGGVCDASYTGTSAVIGVSNKAVNVYGLGGWRTEQLLFIDTNQPPLSHIRLIGPPVDPPTSQTRRKHRPPQLRYSVAIPTSSVNSTRQQTLVAGETELSTITTPSAPSPTPMSLRPQWNTDLMGEQSPFSQDKSGNISSIGESLLYLAPELTPAGTGFTLTKTRPDTPTPHAYN